MKKLIALISLTFISTVFFQGCATVAPGTSDSSAISQVSPLVLGDVCPTKIGFYQTVKNRNAEKDISVKIQTDISPDPDNIYPKTRSYNVKAGTSRILGCTRVKASAGDTPTSVSFIILSAEFI